MSTQIWSYSPRLDWSQLIDCCCCSYRSSQSQVWQQILMFDATNQCSCLFIWTFNCFAASNVQVDGVRCFVNRWLSHAIGSTSTIDHQFWNFLYTICCQSQCLEMFSFLGSIQMICWVNPWSPILCGLQCSILNISANISILMLNASFIYYLNFDLMIVEACGKCQQMIIWCIGSPASATRCVDTN